MRMLYVNGVLPKTYHALVTVRPIAKKTEREICKISRSRSRCHALGRASGRASKGHALGRASGRATLALQVALKW